MHPTFQKLFTQLEAQRENLMYSVQSLSTEQLNFSPTSGKWSTAQILSHLITAEKLTVVYIRKKMQGAAETDDSGWWEDFKMFLLKISQRFPGLKFRAPKKVKEATPSFEDLQTISQEWNTVRADLKGLLEKIPDAYVNRKIFKHVRAGYLNVGHALMFIREHIIHHQRQIKRLANMK